MSSDETPRERQILRELEFVREENERLKILVSELLPFMYEDVRNGLKVGPGEEDHDFCDCRDCWWWETSTKWKARIDSGEFGYPHENDENDKNDETTSS